VRHNADKDVQNLDAAALEQLALRYVTRYATTQQRLYDYLLRKCRAKGGLPDRDVIDIIVQKMVLAGFVDDLSYAEMRTGALLRRGYGARRIGHSLRQAGISAETTHDMIAIAPLSTREAAIRFAQRRKLGPFTQRPETPQSRQRDFSALLRAGHDFEDARAVMQMIVEKDEEDEIKGLALD